MGAAIIGTVLLQERAHQQILDLLVVVQHHPVRLAADTGLLVAAERRMRRIEVAAIYLTIGRTHARRVSYTPERIGMR